MVNRKESQALAKITNKQAKKLICKRNPKGGMEQIEAN